MANVLSILPEKRFKESDVTIPPGLKILFKTVVNEEDIIDACMSMDVLFLPAGFPDITKHIIENIPSIQMIQSAGTGFDKVDIHAAAQNHIPVCNSPGQNVGTVAEFTIAQIINLMRNIIYSDCGIKAGNYSTVRETLFKSGIKEMSDIIIGILGLGAIGKAVAKLSGMLGSTIKYYDINRADKQVEEMLKAEYVPFEDLLSECDVVSIHLPLIESTKNLIGTRELEMMSPGSYLVNTARGQIIEPNALAQAIENGPLAGAAVDTIFPEPPLHDHPLLNLSKEARDRLVITPHIAGITKSSFRRLIEGALDNIVQVSKGNDPDHVVNGIEKARAVPK